MRKYLILAAGWGLIAVGIAAFPLPLPAVSAVPTLLGLAILSTHYKPFRRWLQYMRHRHGRFSRWFDNATRRGPAQVKAMGDRTHPGALSRRARRRARLGLPSA